MYFERLSMVSMVINLPIFYTMVGTTGTSDTNVFNLRGWKYWAIINKLTHDENFLFVSHTLAN